MHFVCVEVVEQHGSTRSTRRTCRVASRRDVTSQVEFELYGKRDNRRQMVHADWQEYRPNWDAVGTNIRWQDQS